MLPKNWTAKLRGMGRTKVNRDYCAPYGILKTIVIALGVCFLFLVSLPCIDSHCYTNEKNDILLRIFLTAVSIFCIIGSSAFGILHFVNEPDYFAERKILKILESTHTGLAAILTFTARYYCANYYGGVEHLEGRWIAITVFAWSIVVVYIMETFLLFGISIRCGGHPPVHDHAVPHLTLQQALYITQGDAGSAYRQPTVETV